MTRQTPSDNPIVLDRLSALAEPLRLRTARVLERHELSVGELASVLQVAQSTVSRHLKVLLGAGWLQRRAAGTATFYALRVDDLTRDARDLWVVVREQAKTLDDAEEDNARLEAVLAERRTDSMAFFGRVAGEWDAVRHELFGEAFLAEALPALLPGEWTVLDLGCGTGNASELIAPHVERVIAIDGSDAMLDAARKRLTAFDNVEFCDADASDTGLEDASVDAVICVLLLHHVKAPVRVLQEVQRVLRPGGVALVIDMVAHARDAYRQSMGHRHLGFDLDEFERWMIGAGFDAERTRVSRLRAHRDAKGPGLFIARGERVRHGTAN
ncbi:MAG: metalloregulator ArsR/SmtB family transcription factor [Planctomycetota bacterium]